MDRKKVLEKFGITLAIVLLFCVFIVILTLIMMSLGPQAPSTPKMICDTINGTTFCHF
jgi:hypothetical protein